MARLPRYFVPGQPQHVLQRGNNRTPIFVIEEDYACFLDCLADAILQHGAAVHAYVLMTNHVHLLMTPQDAESLPKILQSVGRRYVQYFNYIYQRTGTLWEGRYKATLIDSDQYFLRCYRYIELNPVRAHMVTMPGEYRWSSYRHHAHGSADTIITDHALYRALGTTDQARQGAYRALFSTDLDDSHLDEIREATNKAWVLGSDRFKEEVTALAQRRARPLPKGRPKKSPINRV
jgi:putative transposase